MGAASDEILEKIESEKWGREEGRGRARQGAAAAGRARRQGAKGAVE